ncbi:MAG: GNAT family N-acetyltransferase [Blastocatellia bacterium AA13]|nr:MAG: GNAT family N-acetyltransferase [Blastocatellia bacterium AA13]
MTYQPETQNNPSPSDFSRDMLLRDGLLLSMRAIRPDDRAEISALFERCSRETIRFRFLHLIKSLPQSLLDEITIRDAYKRVALVVTLGEGEQARLIAVGGYSAYDDKPEVAEVSFLVEDSMQRRGIGTVLLDSLAEIARDHGIKRFSADVLADNRTMLSVFRKAGYAVSAAVSYGVTHIEFPIQRQRAADLRAEAQEAEAERISLKSVMAPSSIAVIGAGRSRTSVGGALFRNLLLWGFNGPVYPINTTARNVGGVRAFAKLSDLPETPELVYICVPADSVLEIARDCSQAGVRAVCVISAGFAESGEEGASRQAELVGICRSAGIRLVGPNCMGLVNTAADVRMLGTFAPAEPPSGNVAMSSQSGALGLALLNRAAELGLGVSSFISVGNKADVSGNDLLQYWEADEATDVMLLYLESFGNPRRFARIARRVSRAKPIVAVKAGRTAGGARAASSHTAALASSDRAADALFAQTGMIRVDTLSDFFSVARLLATQPIPKGKRICILTNAGGPAILAVDAAEGAGLEVPVLDDETQERLRKVLATAASVKNPIDMTASAGARQYRECLEILCDAGGFDALLIIFIPPLVTPSAEVASVVSTVLAGKAEFEKTVAAVFLDSITRVTAIPAGVRTIPVYDFPEGAIAALAAAVKYGVWRSESPGEFRNIGLRRQVIEDVMERNGSGWLDFEDVHKILDAAGIRTIESRIVHAADEASAAATEIGRPSAMKIEHADVLHKSDVDGVILNVSPESAGSAFEQLARQVGRHGVKLNAASLSPMAAPGVEVIAGLTHDPLFGSLVVFGLGGVFVELFEDVAFRVIPLTDRDATEMIEATRAGRLLKGFRGSAPADVAAVHDLLLRLAALADAAPRILELDLNPVIVHSEGQGFTIVDARVKLAEPT